RVLVRFKPGRKQPQLLGHGRKILREFADLDVQMIEVPADVTVLDTIKNLKASGDVEFAEPDYRVRLSTHPNDPFYASGALWGLNNTGQSGGAPDADIDAPEAWSVFNSAKNIIVAVVDSGIRYSHEDLAGNLWRNTGEIAGNRRDDDGNGVVDDIYGYNGVANNGDPMDDNGHGTHVAGTIGAVANNGKGVAGVAWGVQIMACKFLDYTGNGQISDAIECINYARSKGAKIINASWTAPNYSSALNSALQAARSAGIIVVCAAGNEATNIDSYPIYPASYNLDNLVVVAAMTRTGLLDTAYSNYGVNTVDLAAPGTSIMSTWHTADNAYMTLSGTSMAAPHVAGTLALMRAYFPNETVPQLIARLRTNIDPVPSLVGKTAAAGRVNLRKALGIAGPDYVASPPPATLQVVNPPARGWFQPHLTGLPGRSYLLQASSDLVSWTNIATNMAGTDGKLFFTDTQAGNHRQRFYRSVSLP
ncbi:MAG: S8 family peptidase, partial [Verrucomicrobiota bacterium]